MKNIKGLSVTKWRIDIMEEGFVFKLVMGSLVIIVTIIIILGIEVQYSVIAAKADVAVAREEKKAAKLRYQANEYLKKSKGDEKCLIDAQPVK